jgi:hypothetical protein
LFDRFRETLIKCLATACIADLPHGFGKNAQNTTSIPALFACTMQQIYRYNRQQALISVSLGYFLQNDLNGYWLFAIPQNALRAR